MRGMRVKGKFNEIITKTGNAGSLLRGKRRRYLQLHTCQHEKSLSEKSPLAGSYQLPSNNHVTSRQLRTLSPCYLQTTEEVTKQTLEESL